MGLPQSALDVKLIAGPATRGEAAREFALDTIHGVRTSLERLWEDFRSSDRFFKYKAGVIAGWVAISVLTIVGTCRGGHSTGVASNSIGAFARYERSAELRTTALLLENRSRDTWKQVALTIDGAYTSLLPQVAAGGRAVIELRKFNGAKGETPPADYRPQKLDIRCSEGSAEVDLAESP